MLEITVCFVRQGLGSFKHCINCEYPFLLGSKSQVELSHSAFVWSVRGALLACAVGLSKQIIKYGYVTAGLWDGIHHPLSVVGPRTKRVCLQNIHVSHQKLQKKTRGFSAAAGHRFSLAMKSCFLGTLGILVCKVEVVALSHLARWLWEQLMFLLTIS